MKNETYCLALRQFPTDPILIVIWSLIAVCAFLSIIFAILLGLRFYQSTAFHRNVQLLIYLLLLHNIIYNMTNDAIHVFHMYNLVMNYSPCSIFYYAKDCFWALIPLNVSYIGFILIQAAFTIERVIATYKLGRYERGGRFVGPTLAIVVLVSSFTCVGWGFATTDPNELLFHCAAIPVSASTRMNSICSLLLIVDLFSMLIFYCCLVYNKRKMNSGRFHLKFRYEIQENLKVLRILFPIVASHFVLSGIFIGGSLLIRSLREVLSYRNLVLSLAAIYIMPYYHLIVSIWICLILICRKRESLRFRKTIAQRPEANKDSDAYFDSLNNQWSRNNT